MTKFKSVIAENKIFSFKLYKNTMPHLKTCIGIVHQKTNRIDKPVISCRSSRYLKICNYYRRLQEIPSLETIQ